ncbi:MAG: helix-turn-helix domain-containing protein [Crocinitomix sp.]|nr:helix-turn-helix domain-containing protein [Crocinitomix sp.]
MIKRDLTKIPKVPFVPKGNAKTIDFILLEELMLREDLLKDHSPFELHRIGFNAILINTGEEVRHKVDFKEISIKKNDALVLVKGQVHSFGDSDKYKGYLILMNDEFMLKHLSASAQQHLHLLKPLYFSSPKYTLNEIQLSKISTIENIWNNQKQVFFEDILANHLINFLFLLQAVESSQQMDPTTIEYRDSQLFVKFNALIQQHLASNRNALFYAEKLAISYKVLNSICKSITRGTAKEYIDEIVTLEAKRLIVTKKASILETAIECGFQDATNFSKYFKKRTGFTPGQFKAQFV